MSTRREFLHCGLVIGAWGLILSACGVGPRSPVDLSDQDLDAAALAVAGFDDKKLIDRLDPVALRKSLREALAPALENGASLDQAIRTTIAADYAEGRTVAVDGWVLSRTEGDLLGLSSVVHGLAGRSTLAPQRSGPVDGKVAAVRDWGPRSTCAGQGFNVQSDGHSSLWIALKDDAPSGLEVMLDGVAVPTTQSSRIITTRLDGALFDRLFNTTRSVKVELFDPHDVTRQLVGQFTVIVGGAFATAQSGKPSTVFHKVSGWGPTGTKVGTAFNPQSGGDSALWIKTPCALSRTSVRLGDVELGVTVGSDTVTARLRGLEALKSPGEVPLTLYDPVTKESVLVGKFMIAP